MKLRFILYRRSNGTFYSEDTVARKQESLRTKSEDEAGTLLNAKNEAVRQSSLNLQIAQVYLQHGNQEIATRTWQNVLNQIVATKKGNTKERWEYATQDKALDVIRDRKLVETTTEHFLQVLKKGSVTTNVYLRRAHNYAVGMHWLPWPVLPKKQWPPIQHKEKRAITFEEHRKIIDRERNPATRGFYQLLWLGGVADRHCIPYRRGHRLEGKHDFLSPAKNGNPGDHFLWPGNGRSFENSA